MNRVLIGIAVIVFLLLAGSCTRWRWKECRSVGHGVAYCVWTVSRP